MQGNTRNPRRYSYVCTPGVLSAAGERTDPAIIMRRLGYLEWGRGEGVCVNHTDAARCHVSGHHDRALARLEFVEHPVTLILLLVAVDRESWPAVLSEESSDVVSHALGSSEDEDLVRFVVHDLLHVLDQAVTLLEIGYNLNNLGDAMVGREVSGADVYLDEVVLVVRGELSDLLGPGSGPHASLAVWANLADDLANLRFETHVQHTISFVENKVGHASEIGLAGFEHVNETARSGDADFHAPSEVSDLATLRHTTIDTGVADPRRLSEFADFFLDLYREFTGWSEDENDGPIALCEEGLSVDVDDGRQTVSQRLSRTGLGNTDDITTRESHGPAL